MLDPGAALLSLAVVAAAALLAFSCFGAASLGSRLRQQGHPVWGYVVAVAPVASIVFVLVYLAVIL